MSSMETNSIDKVIGRRREQHSRQREDDQRIIFRNARRDPVGKFHRQNQHEDRCEQEEPFEEHRQPIRQEHSAERRAAGLVEVQPLSKVATNSSPSAAAAA